MKRITALALLLLPFSASANVGLPMVAIFLPPMWLALVAIIAVEAALLARILGTTFRRTLASATLGNVVSTLIGVPFVWFLLALAEFACCGTAKGLSSVGAKLYAVTAQAPWLIPYEEDFSWMIPAAMAVLLVPFLIASVAIEAPFNKRFLADVAKERIWRATALANVGSYLCLAIVLALYIAFGQQLQQIGGLFMPIIEWIAEGVFAVATLFASK
jgi:hypothetical protein